MSSLDPRRALTIGDVLREHARSRPERLAVVDRDVRLSWVELDARVDRLADALARAGTDPGDRVLWLGQNSFRVLELLCACARLGAILCPANWRQSVDELRFVIDDLEPTVVVWQQDEIGDRVREARAASSTTARWILHDTEIDDPDGYETFLATGCGDADDAHPDPAEPVLAMYTAAFEGRPNAALLSQTALLSQDLVMGRMLWVDDESTFLNSGPLFHIATFMVTMAVFHHGGCNVFISRVEPEEICRLVDAERCTHAFLVRPTIEQIRELNADGRYDLSSLWDGPDPGRYRGGMIGPPGCPWTERPGGFGQTEVVGLATLAGLGAEAEGRSGRPSPVALVRILGDDGTDVAAGESGEIVVRGPIVINGYFRRPELDAERSRDGWHRTGDLGRREKDGSITFVGPMVHMIKSASENIYPAEVEAALTSHPGVKEACVLGVPDPEWSQRVKAVVVPLDGHAVTPEEIIEHCGELIASYKKPREVALVDSLPRTSLGFVDRDAVDAAHGGGGYPGAGR